MFYAMNRFQVEPGRQADFEEAWRARESYLDRVPGFVSFTLLRGDTAGEYISHTTWASRDAFDAWTRSREFEMGHASGIGEGILAEHPRASLYEGILDLPARA